MAGKRRQVAVDLERIKDDRGPEAWPFMFWLILTIWPLRDILAGRDDPWWAAVGALAVVAAFYVAVIWSIFHSDLSPRVVGLLLGTLTAATAVSVLVFGHRWYALFTMLSIAGGLVVGLLAMKRTEVMMIVVIGGIAGLGALVAWLGRGGGGDIASTWYGAVTAGTVTAVILRLALAIGALREAREELARAAVAEERLRFARDLHDLLGHTLSVMVVKAQAVRRLAERDPAVAAAQAADIEEVGRRALTEVRQAVTGYRGRGLTAELDAARVALADASIEPVIRRTGPPLPPEQDALLGWAVREGVTNVIRHSHARHCEISVRITPDRTTLQITNDDPTNTTTPTSPDTSPDTNPSTTARTPGSTVAVSDSTASVPASTASVPGGTAATIGGTADTSASTARTTGDTASTTDSTIATPGNTASTTDSTIATPGNTASTTDSTIATPDSTASTTDSTIGSPDSTVSTTGGPVSTTGGAVGTPADAAAPAGRSVKRSAGRSAGGLAYGAAERRLDGSAGGIGPGSVGGIWGGNGLRGLAERMAAVDGTVRAGPRDGGGFVLTVSLPTGAPASAHPA